MSHKELYFMLHLYTKNASSLERDSGIFQPWERGSDQDLIFYTVYIQKRTVTALYQNLCSSQTALLQSNNPAILPLLPISYLKLRRFYGPHSPSTPKRIP